jgi:hypothetical protein
VSIPAPDRVSMPWDRCAYWPLFLPPFRCFTILERPKSQHGWGDGRLRSSVLSCGRFCLTRQQE